MKGVILNKDRQLNNRAGASNSLCPQVRGCGGEYPKHLEAGQKER